MPGAKWEIRVVRVLILTLGPVGLVGLSYWLTAADWRTGVPDLRRFVIRESGDEDTPLVKECERQASELRSLIEPGCRLVVRPPYLIGGDLSEAELDRVYRDVVLPTARALAIDYFDQVPDEPITILMFSSDASYREHAEQLDGRRTAAYYGYYWRPERRIMLNLATGYGTVAHELTHALAHFDFPEMPEWFDEGLAALHEQSDFSDDGLRLTGRPNWRGNAIAQALRSGTLRPIEEFLAEGIRADHEDLDYAHARYLCLYLQQRQLLGPFYRKFRASVEKDPSGAETLCDLVHAKSLADLDRDFRLWVQSAAP